MSGKTWQVIEAIVTADVREAVEYGFMEAGALGTETIENADQTVCVLSYFETPVQLDTLRARLMDAIEIYGFAQTTLGELTARELPEQDWLTEWKKHWQPVEVGRFVVAPS